VLSVDIGMSKSISTLLTIVFVASFADK